MLGVVSDTNRYCSDMPPFTIMNIQFWNNWLNTQACISHRWVTIDWLTIGANLAATSGASLLTVGDVIIYLGRLPEPKSGLILRAPLEYAESPGRGNFGA